MPISAVAATQPTSAASSASSVALGTFKPTTKLKGTSTGVSMEGPLNRSVNARIEVVNGKFTLSTKAALGGHWSAPRALDKQQLKGLETALKNFDKNATLSPSQVLTLAAARGSVKAALHGPSAATVNELKKVLGFAEAHHSTWKGTMPTVVTRGNVVKTVVLSQPIAVGGAKVTAYQLKNGDVVFDKSLGGRHFYLGPVSSTVPRS